VFEALFYKPEDRLFVPAEVIEFFSGAKARPARKADNLTAICESVV
jgi:hypothetical protein